MKEKSRGNGIKAWAAARNFVNCCLLSIVVAAGRKKSSPHPPVCFRGIKREIHKIIER